MTSWIKGLNQYFSYLIFIKSDIYGQAESVYICFSWYFRAKFVLISLKMCFWIDIPVGPGSGIRTTTHLLRYVLSWYSMRVWVRALQLQLTSLDMCLSWYSRRAWVRALELQLTSLDMFLSWYSRRAWVRALDTCNAIAASSSELIIDLDCNRNHYLKFVYLTV